MAAWVKRIFFFYLDGFRTMTWGKQLWAIILIKLFVMFIILKLIFFPDLLKRDFSSDEERSSFVMEQIINP